MRLEGDDAQGRVAAGQIDHMLVAQMHAIEIANRGRGAAI
jgi:hypothetical protein